MSNVAHSSLTGSNLHEPKGVGTASFGEVYVADGTGSGVWTPISGLQNPFGSSLLHVQRRVTPGFQDDALTPDDWTTRTLNSIRTNEIVSAALNPPYINLPAGIYFADVMARFPEGKSTVQLRIRDVTNGFTKAVGIRLTNNNTLSQDSNNSWPTHVRGRFVLPSVSLIAVQQFCSIGAAATTFGNDTGEDWVFVDCLIWKIA